MLSINPFIFSFMYWKHLFENNHLPLNYRKSENQLKLKKLTSWNLNNGNPYGELQNVKLDKLNTWVKICTKNVLNILTIS